ncbi:energy-coupling factor transporter transmembrane protein EcfT [Candidatus Cyanaurora vandensis]|uniref:energy-coupling factor transporter transmembrane component T family protein n=1 Tax=Candidatus Cyanaurora vandensis TaxID=2714958 RepID=UPI00257A3445|nr:energy-coupling factor transporter transmembrane component T [Candidatus Cyanaurora vandensis]
MKLWAPAVWFRQVNPLLKMIFTLLALALALGLKTWTAMAVLVGFLLLLLLLTPRLPWLGWLGLGLLGGGAVLTYFTDSAGVMLTILRVLAILLPAPVLAGTTPPADLVRALQTVRLPVGLVLGVVLIWRFLPLIRQESERIWEANLLRGIDLKRHPRLIFSGLFVPLIFRMVSYADEVTVGLETRGYDPQAPHRPARAWRGADTVFCALVGVLLVSIGGWEWSH